MGESLIKIYTIDPNKILCNEVIGDVLRIRQILTNLISNAVKFTHEGKVGVNLKLLPEQYPGLSNDNDEILIAEDSTFRLTTESSLKFLSCRSRVSQSLVKEDNGNCNIDAEIASLPLEEIRQPYEKIVLLRCDVYDTGIGIPEKALPSLFKRYIQVRADHARKYGGTGLGLAICKQLVELMGGHLSVTSQVNHGSTFTFMLPYKVPPEQHFSFDSDGDTIISRYEVKSDKDSDEFNGSFLFTTCSLSSGFSLCESPSRKYNLLCGGMLNTSIANNELPEESDPYSYIREKSAPEVCLETLQDNRNKTETFNREDEECQVSGGLMDVSNLNSDSSISYNVESSTCSPVGSILEDNSFQSCQSKLSCQNCRLEKAEQNALITSNGNPECRQKREEQNDYITSNEKPEFPETGSAPKILLVEDNKINIIVAKSMLKQLGHNIDVVHNGLEAIYAVQRAHYDLILMDVCMPVMDGLHATKHIRSFEECGYWDSAVSCSDSPTNPLGAKKCRKRTAIIAMTANVMAESAADCLAVGMDSFVSKPVTFQKLKDCLQQFSVY